MRIVLDDSTVIEPTAAGDVVITQGENIVRLEYADLRSVLSSLHEVWVKFERKPFG